MAHATNDLNAIRLLFGFGFLDAFDIVIITCSSFVLMFIIDLKLTLLSIIPLPFLAFIIWYFGRVMHKKFGVVQASFAVLSGMIQESISGIRIVKAFAQENAELKKMQNYSHHFADKNIELAKISGLFQPALSLIISISILIVLVFGGISVIEGNISIGSFIAFFTYLGMLTWTMVEIGWFVDRYQRGAASMKRLNTIWETEPEIVDTVRNEQP
jgi:ATP-binding cassette subfamily B protein